MGFSKRILGRGEVLILTTREHFKVLFASVAVLVLVLAAMLAALLFMPDSFPNWVNWLVAGLGLVLILVFFGWPWLKWYNSFYVITDRRIITRQGIFAKTGHDIPLSRISNVAYEYDFIDRIFGCGTLVLETSADNPLRLRDVPRVEAVHVELTELLFNDAQKQAQEDQADY